MDKKILITGANGFVGTALVKTLSDTGFNVTGSVRRNPAAGQAVIKDIGPDTDWSVLDQGFDTVIHLAARVHVMHETASNPFPLFRQVNVEGTKRLAQAAAKANVRRLIFLSSVKVNGESTRSGHPFTASDIPAPVDDYGQSKWEAEQALKEIAANTGLETVIIRPPLIYGPGVKGNLQRLIKIIKRGIPLPFSAIDNRRSLLSLDNLNSLITTCITHEEAAGRTFMAADGADLSTAELLRKLGEAVGRPARLFRAPPALLRKAGKLTGRLPEIERLTGSLQVDIGATCATLGWQPPLTVDEGIKRLVEGVANA